MPIGISDLAHSVRKNSASVAAPVQLGHAQQLIVAALGYKSLAAYQAAQVSALEPQDLGNVHTTLYSTTTSSISAPANLARLPRQANCMS